MISTHVSNTRGLLKAGEGTIVDFENCIITEPFFVIALFLRSTSLFCAFAWGTPDVSIVKRLGLRIFLCHTKETEQLGTLGKAPSASMPHLHIEFIFVSFSWRIPFVPGKLHIDPGTCRTSKYIAVKVLSSSLQTCFSHSKSFASEMRFCLYRVARSFMTSLWCTWIVTRVSICGGR